MNLSIWHIWIIAAVILFIIEVFTPTFVAACLALGCVAAGVTSYFGHGVEIQLLSFSIGTLISLFGIRPLMLKYGHRKNNKVQTNTGALIGKIGKVVEIIDDSRHQGRVIVEGDNWRAETKSDQIVGIDEKVEVLEVNSTMLTVKPLKK
jgi:membrane protein implicated in regulation of membrane protease activity